MKERVREGEREEEKERAKERMGMFWKSMNLSYWKLNSGNVVIALQ